MSSSENSRQTTEDSDSSESNSSSSDSSSLASSSSNSTESSKDNQTPQTNSPAKVSFGSTNPTSPSLNSTASATSITTSNSNISGGSVTHSNSTTIVPITQTLKSANIAPSNSTNNLQSQTGAGNQRRRNTFNPNQLRQITAGSEYLRSHTKESILSKLEDKMTSKDAPIGPLSFQYSTNHLLSKSGTRRKTIISQSSKESIVQQDSIPRFDYTPSPEYIPQTDNLEMKKINEEIGDYLQNHQEIFDNSWSDQMIKRIDPVTNPFLSPLAGTLDQSFKTSIPVRQVLDDVEKVEMYEINDPQRFTYNPSTSIKFMSDPDSVMDDRSTPSVLGSYSLGLPALNPRFKLLRVPDELLTPSTKPYLTVSFKKIDMVPSSVEPLLFTGYLYSNKKFISEEWHFTDQFSITIYNEKKPNFQVSTNQEAAFELPATYENENQLKELFLIIVVSHPLTIDGNDPVNRYYAERNSKANPALAKANIDSTFPKKNYEVMTPFAFSYASLFDLRSAYEANKSTGDPNKVTAPYVMQKCYELSKPLTSAYLKDQLSYALRNKLKDKYSFTLTFDVGFQSVSHPHSIMMSVKNGDAVVDKPSEPIFLNMTPEKATKPSLSLRHRLQIHLDSVSFKPTKKGIKTRNIFGIISVEENGQRKQLIHSQINAPSLTETVTTRCYYHESKGVFDEIFSINLPYPIPNNLRVRIDFYHLICKDNNEKDSRTPIGHCIIPLYDNGQLIENGPHLFNISYDANKDGFMANPEPNNALSCQTLLLSSLVSFDRNLEQFYSSNGQSLDALQNADVNCLIDNYYHVLEILVNKFKDDPVNSCKGLSLLYTKLEQSLENQQSYLDVYAQIFAFRSLNEPIHRQILEGFASYPEMNENLYRFLFMLIIKSIYLTSDDEYGESYSKFLNVIPKTISTKSSTQNLTDYARFMNLLFDIKQYSAAIEGTAKLINVLGKTINVCNFSYCVFHPRLFYLSVVTRNPSFHSALESLLFAGRYDLDSIFDVLNNVLSVYTSESQENVAGGLLDSLLILSPLEKMPFASTKPKGSVHPVIIYFSFILEKLTPTPEIKDFLANMPNQHEFFDSLHFLLEVTRITKSTNSPRNREIAYSVQSALLNSMEIMINNHENLCNLTCLIYHFLWANCVDEFYKRVVHLIKIIAKEDISFLFEFCVPPLPKFLIRLFRTCKFKGCLARLIHVLIERDRQMYGDTRRSMGLILRSLYALSTDEMEIVLQHLKEDDEIDQENEETQEPDTTNFFNSGSLSFLRDLIVEYLSLAKKVEDEKLPLEQRSKCIYRQIQLMKWSPDAVVEILAKLADINQDADYMDESIQAKLLVGAIIIEYLTLQNRIKPLFNEYHAAKAFSNICSMVNFAVYDIDECPILNGFCDSPKFNLKSLMAYFMKLVKISFGCPSQMLVYESSINLTGVLWPILESQRNFYYSRRFFQVEANVLQLLAKIPPEQDRLFGHYFRIAYYGDIFGDEHAKTYIYHEKMLTHLFELSTRLINQYTSEFPNTPIELIKESGAIDVDSLDCKNKGYIQITFVEPFFSKKEQQIRKTLYDRSHLIQTFSFDTPFTKGNKAQGTVDQQWLRRTLLTVEHPMPSIIKLEPVVEIINKEFEPIRVAYRQLRERCTMIENAIASNDFMSIQQLLHGSLLVMVNEGPSKMAEMFLGEGQQLEGNPDEVEKYKTKLRNVFKAFLKLNEEALAIHGKFAQNNAIFKPLQLELDSGFIALSEKLKEYIS